MTRVLVAVDESESSLRVASFVNRLFAQGDAEVIGVSVARMPTPMVPIAVGWGGTYGWPVRDPALVQDLRHQIETLEQRAETMVHESGLNDAEAIGELGDPAQVILQAAEERDADLIVVGNRHKGFLDRLLVPSVSAELVKSSNRPVLVVP